MNTLTHTEKRVLKVLGTGCRASSTDVFHRWVAARARRAGMSKDDFSETLHGLILSGAVVVNRGRKGSMIVYPQKAQQEKELWHKG